MKQQDWTEQLHERLADYEEPVPEDLWDGIEQSMQTQQVGTQQMEQAGTQQEKPVSATPTVRHTRMMLFRRWVAAAAACALLLVGSWMLMKQDKYSLMAESAITNGIPMDEGDIIDDIPAENIITDGDATTNSDGNTNYTDRENITNRGTVTDRGIITDRVGATDRGGAITAELSHPTDSLPQIQRQAVPPPDTQTAEATTPPSNSPSTPPTILSREKDGKNNHPSMSPPRLRISVQATNLMAYGGTTQTEQMQMARSYMESKPDALSRTSTVYLPGYDEETDHEMPITAGLSLRLPLDDDWWVTTGLNYSKLTSTFTHRMGNIIQTNGQRLHYIGVPLQVGYSFWQTPRLAAYADAGAEAHFNVKAQVDNGQLERDRVQFSVVASAGLEYKLLSQLSVYVQPGLRYYPDNGSNVQNIFKERPLQLDFQLGVRWSLFKDHSDN